MEKYLHYDIEDFAQEDSFINWVKKSNTKDEMFWKDWVANHPDKLSTINEAKELVLALSFEETPVDRSVEDRVWASIASKTKTQEQAQSKVSVIRRLIPFVAAACVALALIFFRPSGGLDTSVSTSYAMTEQVSLPDESKVFLNSDSKLSYDKASWSDDRTVHLEGEAFFEVEKGQKFTVHTSLGDVQVLGTSFNVFARDGVLKVACETGKVAVMTGAEKTVLSPTQSVTVTNKVHRPSTENDRGNWRKGIYRYDGGTLRDIAADLERQFDVSITLPDGYQSKKYTGSFNVVDLEKALSEVFWTLDLKYTVKDKTVTIHE